MESCVLDHPTLQVVPSSGIRDRDRAVVEGLGALDEICGPRPRVVVLSEPLGTYPLAAPMLDRLASWTQGNFRRPILIEKRRALDVELVASALAHRGVGSVVAVGSKRFAAAPERYPADDAFVVLKSSDFA